MKSLVLLYRSKRDEGVTIEEYSNITENNKHYLLGKKNCIGNRIGILKRCVGEVCVINDYFGRATIYPVELPYMGDLHWQGGYFIFVNKNKYDADPIHYYNMIKNYREE